MKSLFRLMSVFALTALTLSSCHKDNVDYGKGQQEEMENIGYLSLGGMNASVMVETENVSTPTRAEGVDINAFNVVIERAIYENEVLSGYEVAVDPFVYGERPESIALEGGAYRITIYSAEMKGADWDYPVYSATKEFTIERLKTTTINDIVCKLSNIKVTVAYSADILDQLDNEYTTMTIAVGGNSLSYSMDETRGGYFEPEAETNTLKLTLNCRYVGQTKDIVMTNTIDGVKAAQWHKININIQHASDGTATIGIVCDTWTYEEEVVFDTAQFLMEEILIDDTDMPEIKWENHDLSQEFELTDELFDADGNFTSSINLDITSKTAIASLVISVESDNDDFIAEYQSNVGASIDLCNTSLSDYKLSSYGYSKVGSGVTSTQIKFGKQAQLMKAFEGLHVYTIVVTDVNGRKSETQLKVNSGQNVAPKIIWEGYNIDQRQTYFPGMTCDLLVKAPLAISDFKVKIISETLNADQLQGVGLAAEFSLVNDTQFFGALSGYPYRGDDASDEGLGFPVGDEVRGATELKLSITNFLSVLSMLGAGEHDFEMTVTDTEGNATTKTVMFKFE